MLTYLTLFKARYLNQKGQGMVEYAVIVAIVVGIGIALSANDGALRTAINGLFNNIAIRIGWL